MNNKINPKFLEYIYYIKILNYLYNQKLIDNNTLACMTILIAESNPKDKEVIIDLVMNFLTEN